MNDGTNLAIPNAATRLGFRILTRTGASVRRIYLAGAEVANDTTASTGVPGANVCVGRSASAYSGDRFAALVLGAGLSAPQADAVNDRITTYLTAIGAA